MNNLKSAKANLCKRLKEGEVIASTKKDDFMNQFAEEIERQEASGRTCTVETRLGVHYLLSRREMILNLGQDKEAIAKQLEKLIEEDNRKFDN